MQTASEIGARLRAMRNAKGWTTRDLAQRAGCTYGAIGQIEKGYYYAKLETMNAIVTALGGSLVLLFDPDDALVQVSRECPPADRDLATQVLRILPRLDIADRRTLQLLVNGWSQSSGVADEAAPSSPAKRRARAGE